MRARDRNRAKAAQTQEKHMRLDLLPSGWKLWHPIVFGMLAGIGFKLTDPVMGFIMGFIRNAAN